jgi:opacity protein-like surface antigen
MDVMKLKLALVAIGALAAATSSALAGGDVVYADGMKDPIAVPAPIPVPAPIAVQEGFTYYMRGDVGYGWAKASNYSETGLLYGEDAAAGPRISSAIPFTNDHKNVFNGTFGIGAYLTPRIRGDLTIDFRGDQQNAFAGAYSYVFPPVPTQSVNGTVTDSLKLSSAVGLANIYFEPLPRGMFTPYVGAGIGTVYNQITRTYDNTETLVVTATGVPVPGSAITRSADSKSNTYGLAAALMAGMSFSLDHRWALDIGYRALYIDGKSAAITVNSIIGPASTQPIQHSKATLDETWEHQFRVGLRFNIW